MANIIFGWYLISMLLSDDNVCFENAYKDMDIVTEDLLFGECSACISGDCSGMTLRTISLTQKMQFSNRQLET